MKSILFILAVTTAASGCTVYSVSTPAAQVNSFRFENLRKGADYEVLGDVQGHYCWDYSMFSFHTTWKGGVTYPASVPQEPDSLLAQAHREAHMNGREPHLGAMYLALESFKGADVVLPLRWKMSIENYSFLTRVCETVSGKAIKLKP